MSERNALDTLKHYGIHPSVQRIAIMDYLLKHYTHPTVDEVYVSLCKDIPTLSKTTVYNTLRLFSEHGAAQMLTIDEKKICFDGNVTPHAHFMCRRCGKLLDVDLTEGAVDYLPESKEFRVEETHVYYKGICKSCAEKTDA